jgi:hypothetical protein
VDEILFKLTPPEFYVWAYLCARALEQGGDLVAIPRKAPGPPGWRFYTRQHLKRILLGLEAKKYLVISTTPANQHQDLVVVITRYNRLNINVQPGRQECSGNPQNSVTPSDGRTPMFRQEEGGEQEGVQLQEAGRTSTFEPGPSASASAKEKSLKASAKGVPVSLETLLRLDQETLLRGIMAMATEDLMELQQLLAGMAPVARGKRRTLKAKVFAAMRFLQSGHGAKKPEAWVEGVAKRTDYQMERMSWRDDLSGSAGKSPSRAASVGS